MNLNGGCIQNASTWELLVPKSNRNHALPDEMFRPHGSLIPPNPKNDSLPLKSLALSYCDRSSEAYCTFPVDLFRSFGPDQLFLFLSSLRVRLQKPCG